MFGTLKFKSSHIFSDICRVCRCEGTPDRPLFHPCICTGSIKYIHQECLLQWLRYSKKEFCELCNHRFSFTPSKNLTTVIPLPRSLWYNREFLLKEKAHYSWLPFSIINIFYLVCQTSHQRGCQLYQALNSISWVQSIWNIQLSVEAKFNLHSFTEMKHFNESDRGVLWNSAITDFPSHPVRTWPLLSPYREVYGTTGNSCWRGRLITVDFLFLI